MGIITILIVDDAQVNRAILSNLFEHEYDILEAENGEKAWEMLCNGTNVDMILLDLIMPVMDGLAFLEHIKGDNRFSTIPIIVNTLKTEPDTVVRMLELGVDDFMPKPYNPKILKQKVKNLAEKYILEKRKIEMLLQRTSKKLETLTETVPGGIAIFVIRENHYVACDYYNESLNEMLGYTHDEFEQIPDADNLSLVYKEDQKIVLDALDSMNRETQKKQITVRMIKKDGSLIWVGISARQLKDEEGDAPVFHAVFMDITEEKENEIHANDTVNELQYRIEHDILTGIYNRETFYRKTREFILAHPEEQCMIAVWNIDRFKVVNELFGSAIGDKILMNVARVFEENIKNIGIYGRLEADHFASCTTHEVFDKMKGGVYEIFETGIQGDVVDYPVLLHAGFYIVDDPELSVDLMCDRAALALSSVKNNAIDRMAYYNSNMSSAVFDEQTLIMEMNTALKEKQFFIQLQPITDSVTGKVISAEALVRWNHPVKGVIAPRLFIPLFEKNGFITKLDFYVWEEVCKVLAENKKKGLEDIPISVNVSRINFYKKDLLQIMLELCEKYEIEPNLLQLEITESAYTDNPEQLLSIVKHFQNKGFKIMMDDFGSGYSSLSTLKNVAIDTLKIDMNFMDCLEQSTRSADIVKTMIDMTKRMHMMTTAEGVETRTQFELLRSMGCDTIQGYYFSKPLMIDEFRDYVQNGVSQNILGVDQCKLSPSILVVDDVELIRVQVASTLSPFYQVVSAGDGVEAYELLEKYADSIQLMITDIRMPRMDGFALLDAKQNNAKMSHIPSMVLTASEEADSAILALSKGAIDVITKPFEPDILIARVKNMINANESTSLKNEIQTLRGDNFAIQSSRRILESGTNALARLKAMEDGQKYEILFANESYYELHNISRNENAPIHNVSDFQDNFRGTNKKALEELMKKIIEKHLPVYQTVFNCITREGKKKRILSTSIMSYVNQEVFMDILEIEVVDKGTFVGEQFSFEFISELLKATGQNAWIYDIARDEIELLSSHDQERFGDRRINNAIEYIAHNQEFLPEDENRVREMYHRLQMGERLVVDTFYCCKRDMYGNLTRNYWWNRITYLTNFDKSGKAINAIGISEDVSDRIFAKKSQWKDDEYKKILQRDAYIFAEIDLSENRFADIQGDEMELLSQGEISLYDDMVDRLISERIHPDEQSYARSMLNRHQLVKWFKDGEKESRFDIRIRTEKSDYEWYTSVLYFMPTDEKGHIYAVWQIRNVHGEKTRLSHIKKMAEHDPLTGLYNRTAFQKKVEESFEENGSGKNMSAFFMIDVDNFKRVNDTFGHDFGDNILKTVATQILDTFRREDSAARIGGDEYAVFLPRIADQNLVRKKAEELGEKIRMSFENNGEMIQISCSIGIAISPEAGNGFEALYVHADEALYQAKNAGKNQYFLYRHKLIEE